MSTYKREMDKLKLSEEQKKQVLELYSVEVKKKEHSMDREFPGMGDLGE